MVLRLGAGALGFIVPVLKLFFFFLKDKQLQRFEKEVCVCNCACKRLFFFGEVLALSITKPWL